MARTLVVYGAPGYVNPKAVLLQADVQQDSINLTEATNTPGKYSGDAALNVGVFDVSIQDDFGAAGLFPNQNFPAGDPVTMEVPPRVAEDATQQKVGTQYTYTSVTGTSDVTITET